MYCPNCGNDLPCESSKFCPACGHRLASDEQSPRTPSPVPSGERFHLRKAMFTIATISLICALFILWYGIAVDDWWFEYAGGGLIFVLFLIAAVVTGVIGVCSR